MKPEQLEIDRLRKQAVRLKAEREIPKKVAVGSTGQCNMILLHKASGSLQRQEQVDQVYHCNRKRNSL